MRILYTFLFVATNYLLLYGSDTPCNAPTLPSNMVSFQQFNNSGTTDSGWGYPSCGDYALNDFWVRFVAPNSGVITVELEAGTLVDGALNLYWGLCGGLQVQDLGCYEDFDCGTELMPRVTFDNLFPGETYYLKIWGEGGATGTFGVRISDPFQQNFDLHGTAMPIDFGDFNCVQLTSATTSQSGCAWYPETIDFSQPFQQELSLFFGDQNEGGADGITIVFQPNGLINCGELGGGIGAQNIPQSFIVEFDTWNNGLAVGDLPEDHIAISINGIITAPIFGPVALPNIEDGNIHTVQINWNPDAYLFQVYFDGILYLSETYNIIQNVFGGNSEITWGTTAATGAAINQHFVCFQGITVTNNTSYTFQNDVYQCAGTSIFLEGQYQDEVGTYTDFFIAQNGCDSLIYTNLNYITVEANTAQTTLSLPCDGSNEITLDATNSVLELQPYDGSTPISWSSPLDPLISWTTSEGLILDGEDTLTPTVQGPGTYNLFILDQFSGCNDAVEVVVTGGTPPTADAGPSFEIDCQTTTIQLDGTASSTGTQYTYEWTTEDGHIIANSTTLEPIIDAPGTYTLTVTHESGCTDEATVIITANQNIPQVETSVDEMLDCDTEMIQLNGTAVTISMDVTYEWQTTNGNILSDGNTLTPTVNQTGTYTLIVTDNTSGCSSSSTIEVVENVQAPEALIEPPAELDCTIASIQLDGSNSSQGPHISYAWSDDNGVFDNSLSPTISAIGVYELLVTNTENGCTDVANVTVAGNQDQPDADAGTNQTITCTETSVELGTNNTTPNLSFLWSSTSDDTAIANPNTPSTTVTQSGIYTLVVTNLENNCTATDEVQVFLNDEAPIPTIANAPPLTCTQIEVPLNASAANDTGNFVYEWTTTNGQIVQGSMLPDATVSSTGTYTVLVTNPENGCSATTSVVVGENTIEPTLSTLMPTPLTCSETSTQLQVNAEGIGNTFSYNWGNPNGLNIQNPTSATPMVENTGIYYVTVTDAENGCQSTASINVVADTMPPTVDAGMTQEINCNVSSVTLSGSSSPNTSLQWTSTNGNILSGANTLTPQVNAIGIYTLTATNTNNGCTAESMVQVTQDNDVPIAIAGDSPTLTCTDTIHQLNATASSAGNNIEMVWTTNNGNILSDANTLTPTINAAGLYTLTLTNTDNDCTAVSSVEVFEDLDVPAFSVGIPDTINCANPLVNITALVIVADDYAYHWTTPDGTIDGTADTPNINVSAAGMYELQVTNLSNGCHATQAISVTEDINPPVFGIHIPDTLTCAISEVQLSTDNTNPAWQYLWGTSDGTIAIGENTASPTVSDAGSYALTITNSQNQCTATQEITVVQNTEVPDIQFAPSEQLDCETGMVVLDAAATTGGSNFEWELPDGTINDENVRSLSVNQAGTYYLVVTNQQSQCTATDSIFVQQNLQPPIAAIATPDTLNCQLSEIQLDASQSSIGSNYSYQWTTPTGIILPDESGLTPMVSEAGLYTLLVTNNVNGCTSTQTVSVTQSADLPNVSIQPPDTLTCTDTTIFLDASIMETNPQITYMWSGDAPIAAPTQTLTPEIEQAGTYMLTVYNNENGCSNTASVTVAENTTAPQAYIALADTINCMTRTIQLDATASSSGDDLEYIWTTNDGQIDADVTTLTPTISAAGVYELQVTDTQNGCSQTAAVEVFLDENIPSAVIAPPATLDCSTETVTLFAENQGTQAITYQWTSTNGNIVENIDSATPLVNAPGVYELLITNVQNGCTNNLSIEVLENVIPPTIETEAGGELTCTISSWSLAASISEATSYEFVWTTENGHFLNHQNTLTPEVNQAGTYEIIVTNTDNQCTAAAQITVTQEDNIPTALQATPIEPACFGDTGGILFENIEGGVGPYMYSIDGGNTFYSQTLFDTLPSGNYALQIEDANGCQLDTSLLLPTVEEVFVVAEPELQLQIGSSGQMQVTTNIPHTDIQSIQWTPVQGLSCSDCLEPTVTGLQETLYTITITNQNGCTASTQVQLRVDRALDIYIPNAFSPNADGINDYFTIFARDGSITNIERLQIYDRWGNLLFENQNFQPNVLELGWDGFYKDKKMDPAVFTFFAEIELATGRVEVFKGDVTIVY